MRKADVEVIRRAIRSVSAGMPGAGVPAESENPQGLTKMAEKFGDRFGGMTKGGCEPRAGEARFNQELNANLRRRISYGMPLSDT